MLGHYLTVALRNLARHRLHTAVSVLVLVLGLTCFLAAYLAVSYLTSYDRHFANADRSYVVFQGMHGSKIGFDWPSYPFSSVLLADQLEADVPELEAVARYRTLGNSFVDVGGELKPRRMAVAEPRLLTIFGFDVVAGDLRDALVGRNAIVTAGAAQALFGTTDVVGKTVTIRERQSLDVTLVAVIADPPVASSFSARGLWSQGFDVLLPWDAFDTVSSAPGGGWYNTTVETFALAPADLSLSAAELDGRLAQLVKRHVPNDGIDVYLNAKPVSAIATGILQSQFQGFQGSRWRADVFTMLLLFAATVLVVGCVNFVNLATARAGGRAREIGIRKAVGAASTEVIRQELFQTALITLAAVALALAAFAALRGLVPQPWRLALAIPWREPRLWAFLAALVAAVTLLGGLYPALVLARVRPLTALRAGTIRARSGALRTLLVGSQFAFASFLVVAVVVGYSQRANLREALLGRFEDQYVIVQPATPGRADVDWDVAAAELEKTPGIKAVTATSSYPLQFAGSRPRYSASPGEDAPMITTESTIVGYDYFDVLDIPLLTGRAFARDRNDATPLSPQERAARAGPSPAIIDRKAARALGWRDPADAIGKPIYREGKASAAREVIGVVESVPIAVRDRGSQGVVYMLLPRNAAFTIVRIAKDRVQPALEQIDRVFKSLSATGTARSRIFLDQAFEGAYFTFSMINAVFAALGAFAIAIAAVGMFGMASYMTSRRTREIGLRKSQGASSRQILALLLTSFAKPVVIANAVVWPFAFIAAERYLDGFAQRMTLTPWPFVTALLATLLVACAAVGSHAVRAARLRPTDALRED